MAKARWLQTAVLLLKLLLLVVLISWLVESDRIDFSAFAQLLRHPVIWLGAGALALINFVVVGLRWWLLLRIKGIHLPAMEAVRLTFVVNFLSQFLPGGMATSDLLRVSYIYRWVPAGRGLGTLSILLDRLMGLHAMMVLAVVAGLLLDQSVTAHPALQTLWWSSLAITVGMPLAFLLGTLLVSYWRTPLEQWVTRAEPALWHRIMGLLLEAAQGYRHHWLGLIGISAMAVACHGVLGIALAVLALQIVPGTPLGLGEYLLAFPWGVLASMLPITPGGIGVAEGAFDQICRWLSGDVAPLAYGSLFLAFRLVILMGALPGGLFYFTRFKGEVAKIEASQ
uniref:Uncharacterized protein n=1 Tax=Magnetococcus massalia (strain MO-1) TaxID=451514 RepID=A0A1S7LIW4_MAGMO|nr:conserved innermembrane protein of unknown function [Candidatus Magnetococcus massalia]